MDKEHSVIVFGDDMWNTLGIIRSLGEAGIKSHFVNVCHGRSFVRHSRYLLSYHQVDTVEEGVNVMLREFGNCTPEPIVFVSSDPAISCIDSRYDELSRYFILPNAAGKQGEINRLMDKDVMLAVADRVGMTRPRCVSIDLTDIERNAIYNIGVDYPCLTKPLYSVEGTKANIVRCDDADALWNKLLEIRATGCMRVQVQDWIEKEHEMLITGCALPDGSVIVPGIITKLKEYPMGFTSYASIEPEVEKYIDPGLVADYVREMKYSGVFSLEFLLRKGRMYFLEINLRNDGNSYAPTYGGVNIHDIWRRGVCGLPTDMYPQTIKKRYEFQQESNALNYYHSLGGGYPQFFREFFKADFHLHFSLRDPIPAMYRFVINKFRR